MSPHDRLESLYSSTTTLSAASSSPIPSPFSLTAATTASAAPKHASASAPAHVSKTYRQSSTLFLTRRLPEALTTLAPLITPPPPRQLGLEEPAPVATAARNTRIKVWNLYLTILNTVLELDPDEGKDTFGAQEWRVLCAKVRDGTVWEEVVKNGYHGVEGDVDPDVVINLATLLLAHARNQQTNQKRLEAYLVSASSAPSFDLSNHSISRSSGHESSLPTATRPLKRHLSGANTPRDLNARVKILELYTLHVLPRNNEWEYAREFINASAVLDDERREAFLQALQSLQEQHAEELAAREREDKAKREEIARREKELLDARRAREESDRLRRETEQERDKVKDRDRERAGRPTSRDGSVRAARAAARAASNTATTPARRTSPGVGARAGNLLWSLKTVVQHLGASVTGNPVLMTRMLAFVVGLLLMLSNRAIRERLRRALAASWAKLQATAGMGVKVTYI